MATLLWFLFALLVILWLIGLAANIGGALIYLLLVIALGILLYKLLIAAKFI